MSSVQREHEKSATRALDVESFARKLATGFPLDEIRVALERRGVEGDELSLSGRRAAARQGPGGRVDDRFSVLLAIVPDGRRTHRSSASRSRGTSVTAPAWWTAADRAEVAALTRVLVDEVFDHRARGCRYCDAAEPCPAVRAGIEEAVRFVEQRAAISFAQAMRARQDLADFAAITQRAA
jgi:hypothetical protein